MKLKLCIYFYITIGFLIISCTSENEHSVINNETMKLIIHNKQIEIPFSFSIIEQNITKRIWREIESNHLFTLNNKSDTSLYFPTAIKTDEKGYIYILDSPSFSVKKFSPTGEYIKKYGKKGKGPGEVISAASFDVDKNGRVAILDPNLSKAEVFDEDIIYSVKLLYQPITTSFFTPNKIAVVQIISPIDDSIIMEYDYKNKVVNNLENIFLTKQNNKIDLSLLPVLQANILKTPSDNLLFLPKFMNFFIVYSDEKRILGAFRYINPTKEYVSNISSRSSFDLRLPNENRSYIGASVIDDYLISVAYKSKQEYGYFVADYYSINNGNYLYSVKLDFIEKIGTIHFTFEKIFFVNDKYEVQVVGYKLINNN